MNKTMEELIKTGCIYGYEVNIDGDSIIGIVAAVSCTDARNKVVDAYLKREYGEMKDGTVIIMKITNGWSEEDPDVLEICGA